MSGHSSDNEDGDGNNEAPVTQEPGDPEANGDRKPSQRNGSVVTSQPAGDLRDWNDGLFSCCKDPLNCKSDGCASATC